MLRYWSSGTKLVDSKNWVWISTAQPFTYTNWIVGQPDLAAEHCMEVQLSRNVDLVWNNLDCNVPLNFICESQDATVNSKHLLFFNYVRKWYKNTLGARIAKINYYFFFQNITNYINFACKSSFYTKNLISTTHEVPV